jgi:hypothetical protein
LQSLTYTQTTCKDALSVLADAFDDPPQQLGTIHKDLLSFFKLLRASTTRVALSLKPGSPAYKASLAPLKEVSDQIAGLTHAVRLFHRSFGKTLRAEVVATATDIIQSISQFLQGYVDGDTSDGYLARVGTIHDLIDTACAQLSHSNASAVQKKWTQNQESLEDGITEVEEILRDKGEDDFDDGWDELGLSDEKITPEEIERTKNASTIHSYSNSVLKAIRIRFNLS